MSNPLLAAKQDSTTWHTGVNVLDDAAGVYDGVQSGSWVEGGIAAFGTGMDLLTMAMNPVGTLISYGLNWLIEHVQPLQDALNHLAGDADQIAAYSQTWNNVAEAVGRAAQDLAVTVEKDTANWTGQAADAYRANLKSKIDHINAAATCAETISTVVQIVGVITGAVRGMVRDMVTQAVGDFIQDALEEVCSLGLGTPVVVAQVVEQVSAWIEKITGVVKKLINSVEKLRPMMSKLEEIFAAIKKVMAALHGHPGEEPHLPGDGSTHASSAEPGMGTTGDTHASSSEPHPGGDPGTAGTPDVPGGEPGDPAAGGRTPQGDEPSIRSQTEDPRGHVQEAENRTGCGDPVDVVTGHMFLTETDVMLPASLSLVLQRTHISSYRVGRLFGRSWASTLDQRLEVDTDGVCFAAADGVLLVYPPPSPGVPVLPEEGPRWPLTATDDETFAITRPSGETLHFVLGDTTTAGGRLAPLRAISDRNGNRVDILTDADGLPTEVRHSGGYRVAVGTGGGRVTGFRLLNGGAEIPLMSFRYTESGDLIHVVNASGLPHVFEYDDEGRVTGWTDRKGTRYRYHFDPQGRVVRAEGTDAILNTELRYEANATLVRDSLGNQTTYHLNELRQIVRTVDPLGNAVVREWDTYDRLLAETDALGNTTRYRYDDQGNVVEVVEADGTTKRMSYNESGLSTSVTDGIATSTYDYDARGNLVAVTGPSGTTRTRYDARGHVVSTTDASGATSRITTNAAGLPVEMIDPLGNRYRYERDVFGRLTAVIDPLAGVTRYGWTVDGRPAWRRGPDGGTETWRYDGEGNLVEQVDAGGRRTTFEIGAFDLPAVRTTADGARTTFSYDTEQRVTAVINPHGARWTYEYDPAGNLVREEDFHGRVTLYAYDAARRLVSSTNGAGQTIEYGYDAQGRRVRQGSGDDEIVYAYDVQGRLVRAVNAAGELTFTRDAAGRVLTETFNGRTLVNTYDAAGRRIRRTTASGQAVTFGHDALGKLISVGAAGHSLTLDRDRLGRAVAHRVDATAVLTQRWDGAGRLAEQDLAGGRRRYHWRPDGRLVGADDPVRGDRRFGLDVMGRLRAVDSAANVERYDYDAVGNISAAAWLPGGDAEGQRTFDRGLLREAGRTTYAYDGQGRVREVRRRTLSGQVRVWRYTWNVYDQLVAVSTPDDHLWHYLYDPLGRRCAKVRYAPDQVTELARVEFQWDAFELAEQHVAGTVTTWVFEPGTFRLLAQMEGGRFHAVVTDHLGTPTELVDPGGRVAWRPVLSAWGVLLDRRPGTTYCPLRFPGQYHDPETGLHYNIFRYYDPETGRYTGPDPLGLAPAPNHYAYVGNPLLFIDPYGLSMCGKEGPVRYGETDLSKMAYEHRMNGGVGAHQNVAVYEYRTPEGPKYLIQANDPGGLHSEQIMQSELQARGIKPEDVSRIYSERVPCSSPGHDCAGIVAQYKNASITWSLSGTRAQNTAALRRWMSDGLP